MFQSSQVAQWIKDLVLSLLWLWLLLWHEFDPWSRKFHMTWACPKKKAIERHIFLCFDTTTHISCNTGGINPKKISGLFDQRKGKWTLAMK